MKVVSPVRADAFPKFCCKAGLLPVARGTVSPILRWKGSVLGGGFLQTEAWAAKNDCKKNKRGGGVPQTQHVGGGATRLKRTISVAKLAHCQRKGGTASQTLRWKGYVLGGGAAVGWADLFLARGWQASAVLQLRTRSAQRSEVISLSHTIECTPPQILGNWLQKPGVWEQHTSLSRNAVAVFTQ